MKNKLSLLKLYLSHRFSFAFKRAPKVWFEFVLLAFTLLILLFTLTTLTLNTHRGFDITDESYYLLWATQPTYVHGSVTHFGYITAILYRLVGEDIILFRLLGILVLLLSGFFFAVSLDKYWNSWCQKASHLTRLTGFAVVISAALSYYGQWWLLTPSYNWLALVATLIVASSLLLSMKSKGRDRDLYAGGVILGIGGALAFIAKPTTALLITIAAVIWLIFHYRDKRQLATPIVGMLVAIAILMLHALFNFDSILAYKQNITKGLHFGSLLVGDGHSIWRISIEAYRAIDEFVRVLASIGVFRTAFIVSLILVGLRFLPIGKYTAISTRLLVLSLFGLAIFWWSALFARAYHPQYQIASFAERIGVLNHGTFFVSLLAICFLVTLPIKYSSENEVADTVTSVGFFRMLILIVSFAIFTLAYAFGTGNDIFRQMSGSTIFLSAGIFYLCLWLSHQQCFQAVPSLIGLMMTLTVFSLVQVAHKTPYRLVGAISEQQEPVKLLSTHGIIYVDPNTATYINKMQQYALRAGWEKGTPLIDMTGATPGALVILDARILGQTWLLAGYPGSNEFAKTALTSVPRDLLEKAWILMPPDGMGLNADILAALNLDFPTRYEHVVELKTGHRSHKQQLWKPAPPL